MSLIALLPIKHRPEGLLEKLYSEIQTFGTFVQKEQAGKSHLHQNLYCREQAG
jgi:hypothetical protein